MSDLVLYKKMYIQLFRDVTETLEKLDVARNDLKDIGGALKVQMLEEQVELAVIGLREAQQRTERIYIEGEA